MASKKIFQGLPAWSQGIISIAIVGGVGFIAYKLYKTYQEAKALESSTEENKATADEAKNLLKAGVKPTLTKSQLTNTVNGIKEAFKDYNAVTRSHVQPFYRELVKVNNNIDMLNLLTAYGTQTIDLPFTTVGKNDYQGTLTTTAKYFLNTDEVKAANNILARKGIKYRL
jgi:hypothetical protein